MVVVIFCSNRITICRLPDFSFILRAKPFFGYVFFWYVLTFKSAFILFSSRTETGQCIDDNLPNLCNPILFSDLTSIFLFQYVFSTMTHVCANNTSIYGGILGVSSHSRIEIEKTQLGHFKDMTYVYFLCYIFLRQ